jgi:DNA modification methylase
MKVIMMKTSDIKPYGKNPRKNDGAVEKVVSSIREFGFQQPIVVDENRVIIVGHTRHKAALKMNMAEVPVVYAEGLSPQQVKAYRIADNKTNEFAEWDYALLGEEFSDLKMLGYDTSLTAFSPDEMNALMDAQVEGDGFNIDEALKDIVEPKTKVGDIIHLGDHVIMCGDCTNTTHMTQLMDGKVADMIFTDPPYNVDYTGHTADKMKIKNDSMADEKFYKFLYDSLTSMFDHVKPRGGVYVCHSDLETINFHNAFKDAGFELKQCIVWVKHHFVKTRHGHHSKHEPIMYGCKAGTGADWHGDRKQTTVIDQEDGITINKIDAKTTQIVLKQGLKTFAFNVGKYEVLDMTDDSGTSIWRADKPCANLTHPNMKPLKLIAKGVKNSSLPGEIVLDTFGGSGSTLLTCEQMGRKCYTMELDPVYVEVQILRYAEYKGNRDGMYRIRDGITTPL